MFVRGKQVLCAVVAAILLSACAEPEVSQPVLPKPVKVEAVSLGTTYQIDSFVGTVRARQRADLSFESPGRVVAVLADVGDRVRAGQVLARLDDSPARWRLERAQADRSAAAGSLAEHRDQLRRQEALAREEFVSAAAVQAAQSAYRQAVSRLEAAEAAVAAAKRELDLTRITAPFDGVVGARHSEPFVDVAAGQPILQMESGGALEVVVMLPDSVVETLAPGARAQAITNGHSLQLTLERVSSRRNNGSLVQAIFRVHQTPEHVRSGGVVSVEIARGAGQAMTLPATAVMPGRNAGEASVFVIESHSGTLERRVVQVENSLQPGGRVVVAEGLSDGEQVVVAGTAFLHEGQPVVAHEAQTLLTGARP
ncbi:hypothetical protein CAI21_14240 [Alkalilimnicola ehrlichii]|uniref:Uncharacterized protein n=2 Tax=Alkalilimnicola ehrlichii TaxID=351052 RepID=A0A3E0WKU7_9GAMM|nr:hypothetical protein CAI21_14240 [Alkalilimnicola ehrlichii]RFA33584.1 hypothetical protein CAL65_17180 [Alkalilimnicola ehrlichii]